MAKGIKRHPSLRPLSRDHLIALMGAQRLMKAGRGEIDFDTGIDFFLSVWHGEVMQHLKDEERILPEFIKDKNDLERLLSEHNTLREYASKVEAIDSITDETKEFALEAGNYLDKHVRWEEREFFPKIEKTNSVEEIEKLLSYTDEVEKMRQRGKSCEPRKNTKKRNKPR